MSMQLSGQLTDQNTPANPLNVSPATVTVPITRGGNIINDIIAPFSFTTWSVPCLLSSDAPPPVRAVPDTCAVPQQQGNFSWAGGVWKYYNGGPWTVSSDGTAVTLPCGAACFDMAILQVTEHQLIL
jgi:hypothetical protein